MRINKMITKWITIWSFIKFSQLHVILQGNVWRSVWRIFMLILRIKGVEVRWDILWFGHGPLAEYWSTSYQSLLCQHVSWISVDMSANYQSINHVSLSVRWVSVNMLADILADSWPRVGRYVSRKVSKLHKIWEVVIVNKFKQESILTIR